MTPIPDNDKKDVAEKAYIMFTLRYQCFSGYAV